MTKRSSFVIPLDGTTVAANVDILDRSPKSLMQSCFDTPIFAGWMHEASIQGNIAVKHRPIRLLALCTAVVECDGAVIDHACPPIGIAVHNMGELTALTRGSLPTDPP